MDETIDTTILQKEKEIIYILITFPTATYIKKIRNIAHDFSEFEDSGIVYQVASPYGVSTGTIFTDKTKFQPGDYCIGLGFNSSEDVDKISHVKFDVTIEPISNFMISQMIFGLYYSLGFEPSQVLKLPIKSVNTSVPFYRKTRGEINELSSKLDEINEISNKLDDVSLKLDESTTVSDLKKVIDEKEMYFSKLHEAEEYIDHIEKEKEELEKRTLKSNFVRNPSKWT